MIKHLEQPGRRLMDRADDGPSTSSQGLQQRDALETRGTIQARCGLVEEHDGRVVDQLQGD